MSIVIDSSYVEPRSCSLAAVPRYETGLRLLLRRVDRPNLNASADDFEQPIGTVDAKAPQVEMQAAVPFQKSVHFTLQAISLHTIILCLRTVVSIKQSRPNRCAKFPVVHVQTIFGA